MQQYINLLNEIREHGVHKVAARANMPGTTSLFGYQFRHDLSNGFPLLTTKKMYWKGIVVELLWFLRGDTNIKYLDENGVTKMWHEDAYNYYCKIASVNGGEELNIILHDNGDETLRLFSFEEFCNEISSHTRETLPRYENYTLGDCGYQYGRVWRHWDNHTLAPYPDNVKIGEIDQIKDLLTGLQKNPEGRRHILTSWDPAHVNDLALTWCHAMAQFNCRPIQYFEGDGTFGEKGKFYYWITKPNFNSTNKYDFREVDATSQDEIKNNPKYPTYFLDCQLYQRSADVVLGVPFNTASYALLVHIFAKICNMIPGQFVHTFGDVHIYDNHHAAVDEQLVRELRALPNVVITDEGNDWTYIRNTADFSQLTPDDFKVENYNPHPAIKAELSTGLVK